MTEDSPYNAETDKPNENILRRYNNQNLMELRRRIEERNNHEEKLFFPAKANLTRKQEISDSRFTRFMSKDAQKVCKKICSSLRDKFSRSKGARMFRKRRKRASRFTVIGYGTQPVDDLTLDDSDVPNRDTSSSSCYTSSDDCIPAYDHQKFHNFLIQDRQLTPYQKLIKNQLHSLAKDVQDFKSKGATLFAKRQKRIETYLSEFGSDDEYQTISHDQLNNPEVIGSSQYSTSGKSNSFLESDSDSFSPTSFCDLSFNPIAFTAGPSTSDHRKDGFQSIYFDLNVDNADVYEKQKGYASDLYSQPSVSKSSHAGTVTNNFPNEFEPFVESQAQPGVIKHDLNYPNLGNEIPKPQKFVFRSVKPPQPKKSPKETIAANPELKAKEKVVKNTSSFKSGFEKPSKGWSPVTFQPMQPQRNSDNNRDSYSRNLDVHPWHYKQHASNDITKTTPSLHLPKTKFALPNTFETKAKNSLLDTSELHDNAEDIEVTHHNGQNLNAERDQPYRADQTKKLSSFYPRRHFNRPFNLTDQHSTAYNDVKSTPKVDENELYRRKISACIRVLDSDPLQKQARPNENHLSKYTWQSNQTHQNFSPQFEFNQFSPSVFPNSIFAGGDLAADLQKKTKPPENGVFQGKGAKMFAKQQERINRYIKDGSLPNQILPIAEKINSLETNSQITRSSNYENISNKALPKINKPKLAPKPKLPLTFASTSSNNVQVKSSPNEREEERSSAISKDEENTQSASVLNITEETSSLDKQNLPSAND